MSLSNLGEDKMRMGILLALLALALGFGSFALWTDAKDRAALEREARFSKPFNDSIEAFQQKRYLDAEAILVGLQSETERDSPNSVNLASVLHGLGAVTHLQHRDVEAESYYKRAVEIRKKLLKPDDPELASSLTGLALALGDEGHDVEADQYNREVIAICRMHPEIYRGSYAMNLLDVGYFDFRRKRLEEAQEFLTEAVTAFEKYEGPASLNLALASTGLAEVYETEGKYPESEASYRKSLAIQEAHLNPGDADIGRTLDGLANIRYIRGASSEAAALRRRSSAIYENANPTLSVPEAVLFNRRAESQAWEGNYKKAESLYKQAASMEEAKYGPEHPRVAEELDALARMYRDVPSLNINLAEPVFQKILAIREKHFGADSPETAATESDLALLYFYEKKYDTCKSLAARALPIQEKAFGSEGVLVSTTLNRLGLCQRDLNQFEQAEVSLSRALEIRTKHFQPDHPWIAVSVENLASVYRAEGDAEKANLLLQTSLAKHGKGQPRRDRN
jgi:tetratricopeptide (TPR) repeat protein